MKKNRGGKKLFLEDLFYYFCRGPSHFASVRPSHLAFFAFLDNLRVGKFVFEHAPAKIITAPAQSITAPAQIIIAPAQPPATGAVVYTALFLFSSSFFLFLKSW